jgi:hypothetical protein
VEALFLDCGRPTAQLMRDSLGGTSTMGLLASVARALISLSMLACLGSGPYDWSPIRHALDNSLPPGSTVNRVSAVLDSLGFDHTQLNPRDSTIHGRKQEPHPSMIFSTLQVVFIFDGTGHLVHDSTHEVLTGP